MTGYVYIWEYRVSPEHLEAFRAAYGPGGPWVGLFTGQPGYLRTELLEDGDDPGRFVTIDYWASREDFEAFQRAHQATLERIDAECERLTESERLLGELRMEDDRADIAGALLESLEPPAEADVEAAWRQEVAARVAALDAGEVKTVRWEDLRNRLFTRLRERRSG